jgi:hypothetical protein
MCFVSQLTPCPAEDCFFACPAGSTAQLLAAGCLLAAMPLRDGLCPAGAVPLYGWGVPLAGKRFSANHRTFAGADILSARQRNFTNLFFPSAKRDPFPVLLVAACPAGDCFFAYPAGATAQPLAAVPPYGWDVPPAGKTTFSFAGERDVFTLQLVFACPAGARTAFSFASKRKSGSGLRKRKGRPVEIMGRYDTTGQSPNPAWLSLG